MRNVILISLLLFAAVSFAEESRLLFKNPDVTTSYSPLMQEKNARNDSLLPALNGDKAFKQLMQQNPSLWSLENLLEAKSLDTRLTVDIVYIDGIKEEAYCDFSKTEDAENWNLAIGVDFVSGALNVAGIHVQQCLNMVKDSIGYVMQDSSENVIVIPPVKVLTEKPTFTPIDFQCVCTPQPCKRGNIYRALTFLGLSAISAGIGYYMDTKIAPKGKKADDLFKYGDFVYRANDDIHYPEVYVEYNKIKNDIRKTENLRNGFYVAAGAFGLFGVVSFFF